MNTRMNKPTLLAWCFYEWASSSFAIIVTTFIFATYFTAQVAENEIKGTYQWAHATAIAGGIVALLSPILGAIADYSGKQKRWLWFFTYLCIVNSALLWYAYPTHQAVFFTLVCVVCATVGFEIALVFYNSFLPHIVSPDYIGRVSGWAWSMGYFGGIIVLSLALFVFVKNPPSWLNTHTAEQVRITGPLVAAWYGIFSLPLFLFVPEINHSGLRVMAAIKRGLSELGSTIKSLPQQKNLSLYLLAHLIYIDGLNTLFAFGGIYAAGTFKMALPEIILLGLTMNIAAGTGAFLLAWLDDWAGSKRTILISLIGLTLLSGFILFVHDRRVFWALGVGLSVFVGPIQAASRSLMVRITPIHKSAEMFGLYAFSGRITAFVGPWILGTATLYFASQRVGMGTILLFFIVGGFLLLFVKERV